MLQKIVSGILGAVRAVITGFPHFIKKFGWVKTGIAAIILIVGVFVAFHFLGGSKAAVVAESQMRTVELRSIADLSANVTPLSVAGSVSSKSEAAVRAEIGGQITHIYSTLGDYVVAGQVIAEVENASQRATVAQAQGAVDGASAGSSVSQTTLAAAQQGAVASLLSAYGVVNKSIRTDIDPMYSNSESNHPLFNVQSANSQSKIDAENGRSLLGPILAREQARSTSLTATDNLVAELQTTQAELRQMRDYLDTVIRTLNGGISNGSVTDATIAGYSAIATGARAAVTASLASLVTAQQSIETAQKSADTGTGSGATSASQAALTQAQAGLAAARANLEKTIIRAPISGTVNAFSLKVGNYLSAGTVAVVIANNGALEVTAYITDTDAREVTIGSSALIQTTSGPVKGIITRIAPAIDPATKKIEVRIGITEGAAKLLNGQSVTVAITRIVRTGSNTTPSRITLPLSALKVGADTISVFTVDENNKLVSNVVTIGTLLGDRVVIEKGVTADMKVVVDARGLQPGQAVIVK